MSITVWKYQDPRHINWERFEKCPQFCSTSELVNAVEFIYGDNKDEKGDDIKTRNQVTTVNNLVNALYHDWQTPSMIVKQIVEVIDLIYKIPKRDSNKDIKDSLIHNCHQIVDCLRLFCEIGIDPDKLDLNDAHSKNQQLIIKLYKEAKKNKDTNFSFNHITQKEVKKAIAIALRKKVEKKENNNDELLNPIDNFDEENQKRVVLHGILQFTPSILAAIEDLNNAGIDVLLLFNYRADFHFFYKGWEDIYSKLGRAFGKSINNQPVLRDVSAKGSSYIKNYNLIYDMNDIVNGCFEFHERNKAQCYEFSNIVEFADYVSRVLEQQNIKQGVEGKEIFYLPSRRINNLLRICLAGQNERFLDRPIGHFFVAILKMWNPENNRLEIANHNHLEIRDCLTSGLIHEEARGNLLNAYHKVYPFIENERTVDDIISKLNDVLLLKIRKLKDFSESDRLNIKRIGYMNITEDDLLCLIQGLRDIKDAARLLFAGFKKEHGNMAKYYSRVCLYITGRASRNEEMDEELRQIISEIVAGIQDEDIPERGTLHAIKATMENYVRSENENFALEKSNFFDFKQAIGRVSFWNKKVTNHFCFLSDQDLCKGEKEFLPWPLEQGFFEKLINSKVLYRSRIKKSKIYYEILKKNAEEYLNFKKFALFYGILFSDSPVKLSYVKNVDGKENELYYMLRLMGVKVESAPYEYLEQKKNRPVRMKKIPPDSFDNETTGSEGSIRFAMCPYRYVVESIVQKGTVYRDRFLIQQYAKTLNLEDNFKKVPCINDISKAERDIIFGLTKSEKERYCKESEENLQRFVNLKIGRSNEELLEILKLYPKSISEANIKILEEICNNTEKINEKRMKKELKEGNRNLQKPNNEDYCKMCAIRDICFHLL